MSASPFALREGEMETLDGAVVVEVREEREVREVAREDRLCARRFTVRREESDGREGQRDTARRWGRAMTNGMRLAVHCSTVLEPLLPESGRVRYGWMRAEGDRKRAAIKRAPEYVPGQRR